MESMTWIEFENSFIGHENWDGKKILTENNFSICQITEHLSVWNRLLYVLPAIFSTLLTLGLWEYAGTLRNAVSSGVFVRQIIISDTVDPTVLSAHEAAQKVLFPQKVRDIEDFGIFNLKLFNEILNSPYFVDLPPKEVKVLLKNAGEVIIARNPSSRTFYLVFNLLGSGYYVLKQKITSSDEVIMTPYIHIPEFNINKIENILEWLQQKQGGIIPITAEEIKRRIAQRQKSEKSSAS